MQKCFLVSDKTISHWERDESVPDISLIPVIAEIFSVSCDELLKGERKPAKEQSQNVETAHKNGKQLKFLLEKRFTTFKIQTLISLCVQLVGLAFSAFAYYTFGWNMFFVELIFTFISLCCILVFHILYKHSISSEEFDRDTVSEYYNKEKVMFYFFLIILVSLQAFSLPEILNYSLLPSSIVFSFSAFVFGLLVLKVSGIFDFIKLIKRKIHFKNYKLFKLRVTVILITVALLFGGHCFIDNLKSSLYKPAETVSFTDVKEFRKYMETEKNLPEKYKTDYLIQEEEAVFDKDGYKVEECSYYLGNGEKLPISFRWKNLTVYDYRVETSYDGYEILVTTFEAIYNRNVKINSANYLYAYIPVLLLCAVWFYNKKKKNI